jgi:DNA-directed RNA polymerase subunit RPC12/RpoP
MINYECKSCRKETDHRIKETELTSYSDYKILICQECGEKEMVPEKILERQEKKNEKLQMKENKVGPDGGFDREVDPDCESGICGAR